MLNIFLLHVSLQKKRFSIMEFSRILHAQMSHRTNQEHNLFPYLQTTPMPMPYHLRGGWHPAAKRVVDPRNSKKSRDPAPNTEETT